jgi:hypothetical protein
MTKWSNWGPEQSAADVERHDLARIKVLAAQSAGLAVVDLVALVD